MCPGRRIPIPKSTNQGRQNNKVCPRLTAATRPFGQFGGPGRSCTQKWLRQRFRNHRPSAEVLESGPREGAGSCPETITQPDAQPPAPRHSLAIARARLRRARSHKRSPSLASKRRATVGRGNNINNSGRTSVRPTLRQSTLGPFPNQCFNGGSISLGKIH